MINAVLRLLGGNPVAEAGQQQMVGEEAQQLGEVVRAAGLQVSGGLVDHGGRDGGRGGQLGVGLTGAADDEQVLATSAGGVGQSTEARHTLDAAQ